MTKRTHLNPAAVNGGIDDAIKNMACGLGALTAIVVCGAEIPVAEPESVGMSTERLLRIDAAMQRYFDAGNI